MKRKFGLMWRVVAALVLVLSLSLVTAVPASAAVAGSVDLDKDYYKAGDTITVTVVDPDLNTDPGTQEIYSVGVTSSTTETVQSYSETFTEAGTAGNYTVTLAHNVADSNNDGVYDTTDVTVTFTGDGSLVSLSRARDGTTTVTLDTGTTVSESVTIGYDSYPELVLLTEDGSDSSTFTGTIVLQDAAASAASLEDGTLQADAEGETITVYYADPDSAISLTDTATTDYTAPTLDNAVVIGENLVRVEMSDTAPGFDVSTIEAADFTVDGEAVSAVDAYNSSDWTALVNGDTAAAILLTTSQTLSPGQGVTVEIVGNINDTMAMPITSGSFDTLGLSVTPSQAALGETVDLVGSITRGDAAYTGTAYWAVIGLANDGTQVDTGIRTSTYSPVILYTGSTNSGSFATAITLDGKEVTSGDSLIRNYMVLVRTGTPFGSVGDVFSTTETYNPNASGEDIINETVSLGKMGTGVLVSATTGTVSPLGTLVKGDSTVVSGSLKKSDGTGISGYTVDVVSVGASTDVDMDHDVIRAISVVGSTTTASNGNFATSAVFDDAGVYAVTYPAYFTDPRLLDWAIAADTVHNAVIDTFTVGAKSLTATTNTPTAVSVITTTSGVELTVTIDDAAPGAGHITRFALSGVDIDKIILADSTNDIIEKVTFTNGESFGTVTSSMTPHGATAILDYVNAATDYSIETSDLADIASVVLCATDGENKIGFDVLFSQAGTLSIEGQVEETTDDADTPQYPDYTGTTSMTVEAPERLNVLPGVTEFAVDGLEGADGTQDSFDLNLEILNEDGNGLQNKGSQKTTEDNDGVLDAKEIDTITVTLTTTGTEFTVDGFTVTGVADTGFDLSATGNNLTEVVITTVPDDGTWTDSDDDEATALQFNGLKFEQAGSLTVEVEALFHSGDKVTKSLSYDISGESVTVTPTSALAGDVKDVEVTVTKDGSPMNTRFVGLVAAGGLSVDKDGDGEYGEVGEVYDEVWYNPVAEQLEDGGGNPIIDADPVTGGLYDFGDIKFLKVTKVDVQVRKTGHAGKLTALLTEQINITGAAVYKLVPDVTSVVAGIANQVDLTVTEGETQVTGPTLDQLAGNITISQDTTTPAGTASTVDTDTDGTVDVIRLSGLYPKDVRPDTTLAPVTVSVQTTDGTKTGSVDIAAVEPDVALTIDGAAESKITRGFIEPVSITITDPRDGSQIVDADLQITATNLKLEIDSTEDVFTTPGEATVGQNYSATYLTDGLLLAPGFVTSAVATGSATYDFDALAYDLVEGETASITLKVCDDADTNETWVEVATVSVEDATATVSPAAVLLGEQSFISIEDAVDAHGQMLADGTEAQLSGVGTSTGNLIDGAITFAVTPTATGTIYAQVVDDTDTPQTLGTVDVVIEIVPPVEWYSDWTEDGTIGDTEILEAINGWLTDTPHNDHVITDSDILWKSPHIQANRKWV